MTPSLGERYSLKFLPATLILGLAKTKFNLLIQKIGPLAPMGVVLQKRRLLVSCLFVSTAALNRYLEDLLFIFIRIT